MVKYYNSKILKKNKTPVLCAGKKISWASDTNCKKKVIFAMSVNKTEALNFIKELVEAEKLKTIIDGHYTLGQITGAHAYVEAGNKKGNIAITL